jgi:hypothetical protein
MGVVTSQLDIILRVNKRREYVDYKAHVSPQNALVAFVEARSEIDASSNISITDRSSMLAANRPSDLTNYEVLTGKSITLDTDKFLATDVFTASSPTQNTMPLFFQHKIPLTEFNSSLGHKITSYRILNASMQVVSTADSLLVDGILYNNLESKFQADGSFSVYYFQYTVKDGNNIKTYTKLIDNVEIFSIATLSDLSIYGALISGHKTYLIEELPSGGFLVTLPDISTYAFRKLAESRIAILPPAAISPDLPWYVRVRDSNILASLDGTIYKYSIPEAANQAFDPFAPYRLARKTQGVILNQNLIKLSYDFIWEDATEGSFVDVTLYDDRGFIAEAVTTDASKKLTYAGEKEDGTIVAYKVLSSGDTYGIRSIDHRAGIVDIYGINLEDYAEAICTFHYRSSDLEINTFNLNPIQNTTALSRRVVLFVLPSVAGVERTKTVYSLLLNQDGLVVDSDWEEWATLTSAGKYVFYQDPPAWFTSVYGTASYVNFEENYSLLGNSSNRYLILGEVSVRNHQSVEDLFVADIRQRGGGLLDSSSALSTVEAGYCWDYGRWDGKSYPGLACFSIEAPVEVMASDTNPNGFLASEIRAIIEKHSAVGTYAVARAYGRDPKITSVVPGDESVTITWTHDASDILYNIYLGASKDNMLKLSSTPYVEGANTYTVSGLTNGLVYYICVIGGRLIEGEWVGLSAQAIGPTRQAAIEINPVEYVRFIPGIA